MSLSSIGSLSSLSASSLAGVSASIPFLPSTDSSTAAASSSTGAGRFATALKDAFSSLGISLDATNGTTSSTASTATDGASTDPSGDAVSAFVQSLFAALHSQSAASATPGDQPPPSDGSTSQASAVGHAHHGHHGKLASDLQGLISELDPSTSADGSTATTSATTDPTLTTLEQHFDALVAQNGSTATTGNTTLTAFLQAFAAGLNGAPATGNVVSTAV